MNGIDLLWLAGIAGAWYLLGTKRRRDLRAYRNRADYDLTRPAHQRDESMSVMLIILCLIAVFLAFHH